MTAIYQNNELSLPAKWHFFNGKSIRNVMALSITENNTSTFFYTPPSSLFVSLDLTSLPMVEPLSPYALSERRFWVKSARCGSLGTFSMPWTLWCWRQRRTPSQAVTSVDLWGLILWWWPPPFPLSSVPGQERGPSFQRHRCDEILGSSRPPLL